jgi:hypothetical protein
MNERGDGYRGFAPTVARRAGEITQVRAMDIQQRGNDYFARLTPSAGKIKTRQARTILCTNTLFHKVSSSSSTGQGRSAVL